MVRSDGFEPPMPKAADLQSAGITAHPTTQNGGDGRDRTDDIQLAKLALSQLSYIPKNLYMVLDEGIDPSRCR